MSRSIAICHFSPLSITVLLTHAPSRLLLTSPFSDNAVLCFPSFSAILAILVTVPFQKALQASTSFPLQNTLWYEKFFISESPAIWVVDILCGAHLDIMCEKQPPFFVYDGSARFFGDNLLLKNNQSKTTDSLIISRVQPHCNSTPALFKIDFYSKHI